MSAVLLTATVALATAAPEGSVTTPVIFPVIATCAGMIAGNKQTNANKQRIRALITPPSVHRPSSSYSARKAENHTLDQNEPRAERRGVVVKRIGGSVYSIPVMSNEEFRFTPLKDRFPVWSYRRL